ncbi:carboxymethylenebutenolidase [bacterium SCGC AG-212-C10]|nr:carboxymethylenebutenolidase [bacterium SCGC AG-212-C10]
MAQNTGAYEGMVAETISIAGAGGDMIHAYFARPQGPGPYPAVVLLHHMPGWDEWYREATRKFAHHGYLAISPDLYCREGHGTGDEVIANIRAEGGVPDARVVGDVDGCLRFLRGLPSATGKAGVFGTCSGGRHAYLAACKSEEGVDACMDLWGGGVVMAESDLTEKRPVAPLDYTASLQCPVIGLFGDEDRSPTVAQVATLEDALKANGKQYEFTMYPGAGHGFFYYDRPAAYRAEAAVDGWAKIWDFLARTIGGPPA